MRVLWDTHVFLWFVGATGRLSTEARRQIERVENQRLFSIASAWELAIKISIGKLTLAQNLETFIESQLDLSVSEMLPVSLAHLALVARLPFHHRDPFDRLLIVQSLVDGIPIISADTAFDAYGVVRIW